MMGGLPPGMGLPPGVDMAQVMQMMNDPAVQQMSKPIARFENIVFSVAQLSNADRHRLVQQVMSNPQLMQSLMANNPYMQGAAGGGGGGGMPDMAQLFAQMGNANGAAAAAAANGSGGAAAMPNMAQLFAQMGAAGAAPAAASGGAANVLPPEERFASQLIQMGEMGYFMFLLLFLASL
jgi:hypothetical protein